MKKVKQPESGIAPTAGAAHPSAQGMEGPVAPKVQGDLKEMPTVCRCNRGGGIAVCNLPQFYRNFSVMPLFKNFIFPLTKILSLPSLLLCSHLYCMSFMWQDAFLFLCSQNVIHL